MYKIIVYVFIVVALAKAHIQNVYNTAFDIDSYVNLTRQQHKINLQEYDSQMDGFKQNYAAGLKALQIQDDLLIESLKKNNEHLDEMQAASVIKWLCVGKYRLSIPSVVSTEAYLGSCINTAKNQINNMLYSPLSTKTYLENYYENGYEKNIKNCKSKFNTNYYYLNYTMCVLDATNAAQDYTINNQKLFASQMDTSRCSADANIKTALDCNYSIQSRTISQIAKANFMINKCLLGQDECKQCSVGYTCPYVSYMKRTEVNYYSRTMPNLFYGRPELNNCLMLEIF